MGVCARLWECVSMGVCAYLWGGVHVGVCVWESVCDCGSVCVSVGGGARGSVCACVGRPTPVHMKTHVHLVRPGGLPWTSRLAGPVNRLTALGTWCVLCAVFSRLGRPEKENAVQRLIRQRKRISKTVWHFPKSICLAADACCSGVGCIDRRGP